MGRLNFRSKTKPFRLRRASSGHRLGLNYLGRADTLCPNCHVSTGPFAASGLSTTTGLEPASSFPAWRTQFDSVCVEQPTSAAIEAMAAHCEGASPTGSVTKSTARSRTTQRVLRGLRWMCHPSSLSSVGASGLPGAVQMLASPAMRRKRNMLLILVRFEVKDLSEPWIEGIDCCLSESLLVNLGLV